MDRMVPVVPPLTKVLNHLGILNPLVAVYE